MNAQTDGWTLLAIALLTLNTVITRCFFFLSSKRWSLPGWAARSLNYAPIAALAAVIAPEVVMSQGQLISTWQDARLCAALVGAAYFLTHRHHRQAVLGTMVVGMMVYLPLHIGLGW